MDDDDDYLLPEVKDHIDRLAAKSRLAARLEEGVKPRMLAYYLCQIMSLIEDPRELLADDRPAGDVLCDFLTRQEERGNTGD